MGFPSRFYTFLRGRMGGRGWAWPACRESLRDLLVVNSLSSTRGLKKYGILELEIYYICCIRNRTEVFRNTRMCCAYIR